MGDVAEDMLDNHGVRWVISGKAQLGSEGQQESINLMLETQQLLHLLTKDRHRQKDVVENHHHHHHNNKNNIDADVDEVDNKELQPHQKDYEDDEVVCLLVA